MHQVVKKKNITVTNLRFSQNAGNSLISEELIGSQGLFSIPLVRPFFFFCMIYRICKRPLGRPRRRWVDNIRIDLQEVGCGYMD